MRVRTAAVFARLRRRDVEGACQGLQKVVEAAAALHQRLRQWMEGASPPWVLQTCRLVFNDPLEWLPVNDLEAMRHVLTSLDVLLAHHGIEFCALGQMQATSAEQLAWIPSALQCSGRFNVSVALNPGDYTVALAVANTALTLPERTGGLGNFRFCVGACCPHGLPFFPGATCRPAASTPEPTPELDFSLGLENGDVALAAMRCAGSIQGIVSAMDAVYLPALKALEAGAEAVAQEAGAHFLGIDTSFNPSLDPGYEGSVAHAFELLSEVDTFGHRGTLAAVAAVTKAVQALPVKQVGYCGLMLPVCEDRRLAELSGTPALSMDSLLSLSSVCGVGIDTVPVPARVEARTLAQLYLDVVGLAHRWKKPLTCRVLPMVGAQAGDMSAFESPYLVNARVFSLNV